MLSKQADVAVARGPRQGRGDTLLNARQTFSTGEDTLVVSSPASRMAAKATAFSTSASYVCISSPSFRERSKSLAVSEYAFSVSSGRWYTAATTAADTHAAPHQAAAEPDCTDDAARTHPGAMPAWASTPVATQGANTKPAPETSPNMANTLAAFAAFSVADGSSSTKILAATPK